MINQQTTYLPAKAHMQLQGVTVRDIYVREEYLFIFVLHYFFWCMWLL